MRWVLRELGWLLATLDQLLWRSFHNKLIASKERVLWENEGDIFQGNQCLQRFTQALQCGISYLSTAFKKSEKARLVSYPLKSRWILCKELSFARASQSFCPPVSVPLSQLENCRLMFCKERSLPTPSLMKHKAVSVIELELVQLSFRISKAFAYLWKSRSRAFNEVSVCNVSQSIPNAVSVISWELRMDINRRTLWRFTS